MPPADFEPSPLAPRRTPEEQARDRDLGFGAVVGRASRERLLNRDGSFNVARTGLGLLETLAPYQLLLTISWTGFLGLVTLLYVAVNLVFAAAYLACGPDALLGPGSNMFGGTFGRVFFFSIQTFATIGYGQLGPNGVAANLVVTVEALVGLMYQALATGLLFARFARPTASILFSRHAVVAPYPAGTALMFRIVNRRRNEIIGLEAQVLFSAMEPDGRGGSVRRYSLLPLERNKVAFFPLSWTVVHPIDDTSPGGARAGAGGNPGAAVGHRRNVRADCSRALLLSCGRNRLERTISVDVPRDGQAVARVGRHQPDPRDRAGVVTSGIIGGSRGRSVS
jgi:inward rectifier potassium channel